MTSRPWETKEWKIKRQQFINEKGGKCEICGSTEKLNVAHLIQGKISKIYALGEILEQQDNYKQLFKTYSCPVCKSRAVYYRKTTLDYRCSNRKCCKVSKKEELLTDFYYIHSLHKHIILNLLKDPAFNEASEKAWSYFKQKRKEEYLSFENARLLCNRCHLAEHHFMNLCPICKKNYKSINYKTCLECNPNKKKIMKRINKKKRIEEIPNSHD
jgi:hypothetical protein